VNISHRFRIAPSCAVKRGLPHEPGGQKREHPSSVAASAEGGSSPHSKQGFQCVDKEPWKLSMNRSAELRPGHQSPAACGLCPNGDCASSRSVLSTICETASSLDDRSGFGLRDS